MGPMHWIVQKQTGPFAVPFFCLRIDQQDNVSHETVIARGHVPGHTSMSENMGM